MEEAREPMGAHKKVHIRRISENPDVAERWEEAHGRLPTEEDVVAMFEEFVPLQLDCLADYAELIPGTLDFVAEARDRGLKIGSTTGYTVEMMDLIKKEAAQRGYEPDHSVSAAEVPEGRPAPWMCLENAKHLGAYPLESIVKVDDTLPGIEEGINAGMWTVGLAKSGNEIGLTESEIEALTADDYGAPYHPGIRANAAGGRRLRHRRHLGPDAVPRRHRGSTRQGRTPPARLARWSRILICFSPPDRSALP